MGCLGNSKFLYDLKNEQKFRVDWFTLPHTQKQKQKAMQRHESIGDHGLFVEYLNVWKGEWGDG